jgi:hypothetical protein
MSHDETLDLLVKALRDLNGKLLEATLRGRIAGITLSRDGMLLIGCAPGTTCTVQTSSGPVVIRDESERLIPGLRFA